MTHRAPQLVRGNMLQGEVDLRRFICESLPGRLEFLYLRNVDMVRLGE